MMTVEQPEALAKEPLSPVLASQLDTMVPSGSWLTGKILPTERAAIYSIINILNRRKVKKSRKTSYPWNRRRRIGQCRGLQQQRNTQFCACTCMGL